MKDHLVIHIHEPELTGDNTLHVIGVLFNPMRFQSRIRLFRDWYARMLATANVKVYIVELAYGDRAFEVTEPNNPAHLQLRTDQTIWHKESLINLAEERLLPNDWKYMCWSDTDVQWLDPHWAQEALHQLQQYPLIQPWSEALDMGFFGTTLQMFKSFGHQHRRGVPKQTHPSQPYQYAHSGYAWCCRRDWWEAVGQLMDFPILGSADHHMAFGSIGQVQVSVHQKMHDNFKKRADDWAYKSSRFLQGRVGFVPGTILHQFHGPKNRRQYRERWQIFIDHGFDPIKDLTYSSDGLVHLIGKPALHQACSDYLSFRHEDSIENY